MAKKLTRVKRRNLIKLISKAIQRKEEWQYEAFLDRQNRAYMAIYC